MRNFFSFITPPILFAIALTLVGTLAFVNSAKADETSESREHHFNVVFSPETTAQEVVWQALNIVDGLQTRDIAGHPDRFQEVGQVAVPCSNHPSKSCATLVIALFGIAHYAISVGLENLVQENPDYRVLQRVWQYGSFVYKAPIVLHNHNIGLKP